MRPHPVSLHLFWLCHTFPKDKARVVSIVAPSFEQVAVLETSASPPSLVLPATVSLKLGRTCGQQCPPMHAVSMSVVAFEESWAA